MLCFSLLGEQDMSVPLHWANQSRDKLNACPETQVVLYEVAELDHSITDDSLDMMINWLQR